MLKICQNIIATLLTFTGTSLVKLKHLKRAATKHIYLDEMLNRMCNDSLRAIRYKITTNL